MAFCALALAGIARITGSLLLPLLTEMTNLTTGFASAALLLLVSAALSLRLPDDTPPEQASQPAPAPAKDEVLAP